MAVLPCSQSTQELTKLSLLISGSEALSSPMIEFIALMPIGLLTSAFIVAGSYRCPPNALNVWKK